MSSDLRSLDDVLIELDISSVSWMAKPERDISDDDDSATSIPGTLQDFSSRSVSNSPSSTENTLVEHRSNLRIPGTSAPRSRFHLGIRDVDDIDDVEEDDEAFVPTPPPPQYHEFVEQVLRNARRSGYANTSNSNQIPISRSSPLNGPPPTAFDRTATFGDRTADQMKHDRRIGAAGEAFVFETLSGLKIPDFGHGNWQSTIRGELALHEQYADMANWRGRETADIVYKDCDGSLTRWLRQNCTGGFPEQIADDHHFAAYPIEYYLEVKSTTGTCSSRFFLSSGQYERMQEMTLRVDQLPSKVYVIMRVFDLSLHDIGMKIFVDPLRLHGWFVAFEAQGWFGRTL